MATLGEIEKKAKVYGDKAETLKEAVGAYERELEIVRNKHIKTLTAVAKDAADAKDELAELIEESPSLFEKPRTVILHGIKLGFQKQKGKIVIDDNSKCVELIHQKLPEMADALIRVEQKPDKTALAELSAKELKMLGVQVTADVDTVYIKSAGDVLQKFVDELMKEAADKEKAS